ncbi:MAG: alpha/beta hydrolase family esterase [Pseudomonadota bacterium]
MAGLGDTLRGLSRARTDDRDGAGEMSETISFGRNPGGLVMRSYVPEGLEPGAPLVVVLHGCTQDAEAHAGAAGWLSLADRLGFAVLAPQQVAANNANRCFSWFKPGDTRRGAREPASIHAMVEHMQSTHRLDPARVFISGLSAGGAMTAVMLSTYPEVFAAGAVVAGLPYGVAAGLQEALAAMRGGCSLSTEELVGRVTRAAPQPMKLPRLIIWHGDADHTVNCLSSDALARQWSGVHGLAPAPDVLDALPGRRRARWLAPDGEIRVEQHTVHGFGHGTPLATGGGDAHGFTAPFMLEAGVSSSLVTAQFWGLAPESQEEVPHALSHERLGEPPSGARQGPAGDLAARVLACTARHVPPGVQEVIAKALAAAGLRR